MIDLVKLRIFDKEFAQRLRQNPNFDFVGKINPDTGEQRDGKLTAELKNLKVTLYPSGLVEITGSLHKFANGGAHNYDAFNYTRLVKTIGEVAALLGTTPDRLTLHNVEFGVNVILTAPPEIFLNNILNYWCKIPDVRTFGGGGNLKNWIQQNYIVKVYDKKQQYHLNANVLRFEVKTIKMVHLKGIYIQTLADLLDVSKLRRLGIKLCETYKGLMIYEKLNTAKMSQSERRIYEQGINPNFWRDLTDRKQRNYYRGRFEQVLKQYGLGIRETVGRLIEEKVEELLKISDVLPNYNNKNLELGRFTSSSKGIKRPINKNLTTSLIAF